MAKLNGTLIFIDVCVFRHGNNIESKFESVRNGWNDEIPENAKVNNILLNISSHLFLQFCKEIIPLADDKIL